MKYYYGNSYKEAVSNAPVEIKSTKQLRGYEENYSVVIPADDVLPSSEEMEIDSCLADSIEDSDYVEEVVNNYLSDKYGYCVETYDYEIQDNKILINNIDWDLSE